VVWCSVVVGVVLHPLSAAVSRDRTARTCDLWAWVPNLAVARWPSAARDP